MRIVRWLAAILLVAVLPVVGTGVGLLAMVSGRALPQTAGALAVPGLSAPVTIERDGNGIAQVYASSSDDLFLAQGWLHASERMWQMEVWRHISAGRLSELFGASQVETDRFVRTLDWRRAAERDLAAASPGTRRALERYSAGVNAWLDANRGHLGLPFVVVGLENGQGGLGGYDPEPWTPVDSVAFGKLQAWSLGGNFEAEAFRVAADARFGSPALTDRLFPPYPADAPIIYDPAAAPPATPNTAAPIPAPPGPGAAGVDAVVPAGDLAGLLGLARMGERIPRLAGIGGGALAGPTGIGSNNWVVGPDRSATGTALLANDPHLGIQMPSVWYMNGLHCAPMTDACPYDVAGVSFPGVPAVILGHNARIAWGATNVGPDVQDLFVETPDPADPARYLHAGTSLPYETRQETIEVAGGEPVSFTVRETIHGPVVNDVVDSLADASRPYALRWTALAETDGLLDSFFALDRAGSFAEFRAALQGYGAPSQNFVYADVDGNIGYQMPGLVPIRPAGDLGDRPVDGASGAHDWTGYIPYAELPAMENPASGIIVTANNLVAGPGYPYLIHRETDAGWRASRIRQLLDEAAASGGGVTFDELAAPALDTRPLRADEVIPYLLAVAPATDDGRTLQDRIRAWDRHCPVDSLGCAAYEVTEWRLLRGLFDPWLGTLAIDYLGSEPSRLALRAALADSTSPFWDDPGTGPVETRDQVIAAAIDGAGVDLRAALGDPARWSWGRVHTTTFAEQTLGTSGIGPLEWYFDMGPVAVPGTADAPDNTSTDFGAWYPDPDDPSARPGTLRDAFTVESGPSYRLAIDMGALDAARIVTTTGQAGNPFDRHYGDLVDDWLAGRSVVLPFSRGAVDAAAVSTLTLNP